MPKAHVPGHRTSSIKEVIEGKGKIFKGSYITALRWRLEKMHSVSLVFPKQDHEIDGFIGIHFPFWWPFLKEAGNIC